MALVIRLYYLDLVRRKGNGEEITALPTAYGCPANIVPQTFAELRRGFGNKLNIKVVFSSKVGAASDPNRAEATVDARELNEILRRWMDSTDDPAVSLCNCSRSPQQAKVRKALRPYG